MTGRATVRRFAHRLLGLLGRTRAERDLDEEIRGHLELLATEYEERGMSPSNARLAARRAFGQVEPMREVYRDTLALRAVDDLRRDVHHALRALRRTPAFTCIAVLTLALAIGANTAIFSVLHALLLRPLPVHEPHELVRIDTPDGQPAFFSYPVVQELAQRDLFDGVFAFTRGASIVAGEPGALEEASIALVTGEYYTTLGLKPAVGRLIQPGDDRLGAVPVVVLSYGYWQRKFGGDPGVVGGSIRLEGVPVTIAGVGPKGFDGVVVGRSADLTLAMGVLPQVRPNQAEMLGANFAQLYVLGRLPRGVTAQELERAVTAIWRDVIEAAVPPSLSRERALAVQLEVVPGGTGWAALRDRFGRPLLALTAMVSVVLLIACANVANLLLARAWARRREMTIRLALGAGRLRIVRQVLTESLLLSLTGAVLGVGLAWVGSRALLSLIQRGETSPILLSVSPDARVLAFTAALAVLTALLFGTVPAWRSARVKVTGGWTERGQTVETRGRVGPALVIAQVALSVLLLVTGGLFVRTLQNLRNLDAGFRHDNVLSFTVTMPDRSPAGAAFLDEVTAAVRRVPGVRAVSFAGATPVSGGSIGMPFEVNGQPTGGDGLDGIVTHYVAPGYLEAMRMTLRAGRAFTADDHAGAPQVAIVNEAFVRAYLRGHEPLRQVITFRGTPRLDRRVVGVVADVIHRDLRTPPPPAVYLPFGQMFGGGPFFGAGTYAVLVSSSFRDMSAIRAAVAPFVPGPPLVIQSLTDQVERTLVQERLMALLGGAFAALALLLAAVGLYGLLSYTIVLRTNELGVRTAIGAQPGDVTGLVMRDAGRMIAIGIGIGLPLAWLSSQAMRTMLFRLEPGDPLNIASAVLVLVLAATSAAWVPARRAARIDPAVALRVD